jgi:hypothetical protein
MASGREAVKPTPEGDEIAKGATKMWQDGLAWYGSDAADTLANTAILGALVAMCKPAHKAIVFFQGVESPRFHLLYSQGEEVLACFLRYKKAFNSSRGSEEFRQLPQDVQTPFLAMETSVFNSLRKKIASVAGTAYDSWNTYWNRGAATVHDDAILERQNLAISLARAFDPRQAMDGVFDADSILDTFRFPFIEQDGFRAKFKESFALYRASKHGPFPVDFALDVFWEGKAAAHPELSLFALSVLWLPTSSAEIERFFSSYERLIGDDRQKLSEVTIRQIAALEYNQLCE